MIDWLRRGRADQVWADPRIDLGTHSLPLAIRRHPRARRLTMRLAPDGGEVRITLPQWCGTAHALAFAQARTGWLREELAKIPRTCPVAPGAALPFRGRQLLIDWSARRPRTPNLAGDLIQCGGPEANLSRRIRSWLEAEALRLLEADLAHYSVRAGEPLPALKLSRAQRRWGSCSVGKAGQRTVRINWRLVMAPDPVRRSVVAHEVAHFAHFDHSPAFHAHLAALFGEDLAPADGWLRTQGRTLYAPFG